MTPSWEIREGDALERLREMPDESVRCCVTSPPYFGLRDYSVMGQIGLEAAPDEYVARLVEVFREVRRVLRSDGTLWLNIGDSYAASSTYNTTNSLHTVNGWKQDADRRPNVRAGNGVKPKDLLGIPWMVAFALRADGWWLRSDIIWAKPNPMPESVTDRPTSAHEHVFLLAKSARYLYDADAIREPVSPASDFGRPVPVAPMPSTVGDGKNDRRIHARLGNGSVGDPLRGRNKRNVWEIATQPYPEAHFATFPPKLVEPCVLAGSREGDVVLDPFAGAGTTGVVALRRDRAFIGIELNTAYAEMARERIRQDAPLLNTPAEVAA